ncbi:hypothetical protein [Sulfurospirillum oryzae]|uniref:hypothetical protein n=1 Tax=Sulfurospirillum oryzae TaxID=2976535 RepID=UPI0021E8973B|nr:hypothetical protein [Sulfurospirillum oryzae]
MMVEMQKLHYFKDFIEQEENPIGKNLYMMVLATEAYYEFVAEVLIPGTSRSMTQFKLLEELRALKVISEQEFVIMNETRKLKNELTHRLDYQIDLKYLYDFCNNCTVKDKIVPENKEDQNELDLALLDGLLKSYKIVDLKLYSKVRKELEKVHGEEA